MVLAVLALCGTLLAAYLALHDLGYIGTLACGSGSCELVQTSKWATFLGIKVAVWGVGYYLTLFALAVAGTHEGLADDRRVPALLLGLAAWGVLFTGWLTYTELFLIHAICRWCVGSATIVVALFVLALLDYRATARTVISQ
jgi:uncharacterized membrane protein